VVVCANWIVRAVLLEPKRPIMTSKRIVIFSKGEASIGKFNHPMVVYTAIANLSIPFTISVGFATIHPILHHEMPRYA
jgi:hypothetical protein